jgi:hypothetical protein
MGRVVTDYAELERLAREATPGPWVLDGGYVRVLGVIQVGCAKEADAAYIAAASPDVILALLEEAKAGRLIAESLNNVVAENAALLEERRALREALEQALDRFDTIGEHLKPDATDDDREMVAIQWWFGSEEIRAALQAEPAQEGAPR